MKKLFNKPFFTTRVGIVLRQALATTTVGKIVDQVVIGGLVNNAHKETEASPAGHVSNKAKSRAIIQILLSVWVALKAFGVEVPLLDEIFNTISSENI